MAKIGEGDPRWLVEERKDGTNVNAWHWVERDAMDWCKHRLSDMFTNLVLLPENGAGPQLTVTGLDSVTGEAVINNRKQKIIPAYELEIKLNWEGSANGQQAKGKIHLPYVADENHDEDPEIKFICSTDDNASSQIKQAFLQGKAKQEVSTRITQFVKELRAGGPALNPASTTTTTTTPSSAPAPGSAPTKQATPAPTSQSAPAPAAPAPKEAPTKGKGSGRSIKMTEQFYCRATDVYECFTQEGRLKAFTQSNASVDAKVGGSFSWFGGSVQGVFTELEPGKRITMDWRFNSWEDGHVSKVVISLEEPEPGHTILTLDQTQIPEVNKFGSEDVLDTTDKGWRIQIFQRIRQVFGYGLGL